MSANNVISLPRVDHFTGLAATHAPSASLCLLLSDFLGLSVVFWLAVLSKYTFNPDFHLRFYLAVFPSVLLFLTVFLSQGLYPALLLHPAEEMRRIFAFRDSGAACPDLRHVPDEEWCGFTLRLRRHLGAGHSGRLTRPHNH